MVRLCLLIVKPAYQMQSDIYFGTSDLVLGTSDLSFGITYKTYEEIPKALKRNIWEYAEIRNEIGSGIKDGDVNEKDR